jgi:hypothetical protein
VLQRLATTENAYSATAAVRGLAALDPVPGEKHEARAALLRLLLSVETGSRAAFLADALASLEPSPRERDQIRPVLLRWLDDAEDHFTVRLLVQALAKLEPPPHEQSQARAVLLQWLVSGRDAHEAATVENFVDCLCSLVPAPQDTDQARAALVSKLQERTTKAQTLALLTGLARLHLTSRDKASVCAAVLGKVRADPPSLCRELVKGLMLLPVTPQDTIMTRACLLSLLRIATPVGDVSIVVDKHPRCRPSFVFGVLVLESVSMRYRQDSRTTSSPRASGSASRTSTSGSCVEVGGAARVILVRDTKDRDGGTLAFTADAWEAFTATLR